MTRDDWMYIGCYLVDILLLCTRSITTMTVLIQGRHKNQRINVGKHDETLTRRTVLAKVD